MKQFVGYKDANVTINDYIKKYGNEIDLAERFITFQNPEYAKILSILVKRNRPLEFGC